MPVTVKAIDPNNGENYDYTFDSLEKCISLALAWRDTLVSGDDEWNDFDGFEAHHDSEEIDGVDVETLCIYPRYQRPDGTMETNTCNCVWSEEWKHEISLADKEKRAKWRQEEHERSADLEAIRREQFICTSCGAIKPDSKMPVILWPARH